MENKTRIKLPTPVSVKIHKKLDLFAEEKIVKQWNGSNLLSNFFYYYLFNKYKNNCSFVSGRMDIGIVIYVNEPQWGDIDYYAWNIFSCIDRNNSSEAIVIPMALVFADGTGHSNLLIYRKSKNVIEHFEPHGINYGAQFYSVITEIINTKLDNLIHYINAYLIKKSKQPVTLIRAIDICPLQIGLQTIEEMSSIQKLFKEGGGYCSVWSMFFTEMVLKNPTFSSNELLLIIYEKMDKLEFRSDYLRRIAIGYVHVIHEKIEKYYSFISGIKKITVDEIIEIMSFGNKNQTEVNNLKNDHLNVIMIHNYLLNNPSVSKEEYIAKLEEANKDNPQYTYERLILFLERINTSLLNPSITKSYSQSQSNKSQSNKSQSNKSHRHIKLNKSNNHNRNRSRYKKRDAK